MKKPSLRDTIWLCGNNGKVGGNYIGVYTWHVNVNSMSYSLWISIKSSFDRPIIAACGNNLFLNITELVKNELEP